MSIVEKEVEELDEIFNSDKIIIELTATDDCYAHTSNLKFRGITIASATGRDSGAKLGEGVALLDGEIKSSGSMKNWTTKAAEGSVFRLEIPAKVFEINEGLDCENWKEIEVVAQDRSKQYGR